MSTTAALLEQAARCEAQLTAPGAPFELVDIDVGGRRLKAYARAFATLPALIDSGREHGDKEFMVYEDDRWSFTRFFAAVDALAGRLQAELGIEPGDRIAIAMRNRPEWAVAFAAIALVGAVPVPLNSFGLRDELFAALHDVAPRLLFCDAERHERIANDLAALGIVDVLAASVPGPDSTSLDFAALIAPGGPSARTPALAPEDPALILFTSGASSQAKAVLSCQRAICQAMHNIDYIGAISAMTSPKALEKLMQSGLAPTTLTAVPLFHVSGLHAQLLASLRGGRRLVFMRRWDSKRALELIRSERITQFNGAPSMVMQLLGEPGFAEATASLGGLGLGGAGMPQRVIDDVLACRPDSLSGIGFGMTESNGVGAAAAGALFFQRPASSGRLPPIMELRVASLDGAALADGAAGELCLRGVSVMDGYWQNPQATTQAVDEDGWLHTGDIGYLDADGFLHVVDRIKDVINRSGEKIASAEIESCLLQHPQIQEAVVFAQPDDVTGEAVVAVVVTRPGAELSPDQVHQHVAGNLAAYKVPRDVHVRSEPLPRNPSGKLLKRVVKHEYSGA
ncbi:acyl--CoA ligase [Rhodanobacter glycinis]|uniref:Acyl--CoA ligase n=1 Tax=Rhodanobacter glycinis TaxID=582702 RepID=A0A5B9DZM8_9GAMM|nr:class I adenylate-forming enzyme family protein [Rhodanobacter glycinis]QEE23407.1 acyl--CoA ligase [Rhodanobacter glycinis]